MTEEDVHGYIDDMVDEWHDSKSLVPLHTFLAMTLKEYGAWVVDLKLPPQYREMIDE